MRLMPLTRSFAGWSLVAVTLVVGAGAFAQGPQPAGPAGPPQDGDRLSRLPPLPFPNAPRESTTLAYGVRAVPYVSGLQNPWSLAFLPNGDILVTEKPGR